MKHVCIFSVVTSYVRSVTLKLSKLMLKGKIFLILPKFTQQYQDDYETEFAENEI